MSVPSSIIYILSGVPMNNSYEHTLYFETKAEQEQYFRAKEYRTYERFTYLRPEHKIKLAGMIANAQKWNYLMYQNDDGKWFYHFITRVEYVGESTVELSLELDVIQTYMFDWDLHPCFIERTHTKTDEFGEHTVPEGLETGPLVRFSSHEINLEDNVIMVAMSTNLNGGNAWGAMYGGVYSGLNIYAVLPSDLNSFNEWLTNASDEGYVEAIVSMWMYPKELVTVSDDWDGADCLHKVSAVNQNIEETASDPFSEDGVDVVDGFIVHNKKSLCYPYTMIYVSNNMGGCAVYHRERFKGNTDYTFRVLGALSPDSGCQLIPKNYKGALFNYEEGLSIPAFPSCAWNSDTYKVWLAQNQNQHETAIQQAKVQAVVSGVTAIGGIVASAATMNPLGMGGSFMGGMGGMLSAQNQIESLMAQRADMAIQPDQARGNHSGNINLTHARMGYSVNFMCITKEYIQKIDEYFTRFGYRVNEYAKPSLCNREVFTYIKTVGAYVTGDMPTEYQLKIQAIFDKGVTFWADKRNVGSCYWPNDPIA